MQVRSDVTRYRYGDEQHLEEALKRIFKYGQVLNQVIQHSASEVVVSYVSKLYVSECSLRCFQLMEYHTITNAFSF